MAKASKPTIVETSRRIKSAASKTPAKQGTVKPATKLVLTPTSRRSTPTMDAAQTLARPPSVARKTVVTKMVRVKTESQTPAAGRVAATPAAAKQARPRRTPAKAAAPAARQTHAAASPRRALPPARPNVANLQQAFTVNHLNEADFKVDGLRSYARYRDLGIAAATAGVCQAHVIRFVPPCTDEVRKRHRHAVDLQLVYVLQGWMKNEFAGVGAQMMSVGSCWLQPSGIEHTVLDYSPDCEVLEIIMPADFKTEDIR